MVVGFWQEAAGKPPVKNLFVLSAILYKKRERRKIVSDFSKIVINWLLDKSKEALSPLYQGLE